MKKALFFLYLTIAFTVFGIRHSFAQIQQDHLLYGAAYYDEYMPYHRLEKDVQMMKDAGINVVRIAESTWSTLEPQEGVYDFSHIDRVLNAMHAAGIQVIIGTPTYAVPTWLVKKYPDVLAITPWGPNQYGPRQNMDITNKHFLEYAEKVIRKLLEHVKDHPAIIGYQIDNETKAYNTAGPEVQKNFVEYVRKKFLTLDSVNRAFGLDYWSNRINNWDDFPSMVGSINASQNAEFAKFQRKLVTDYLAWQAAIVREYKHPGQFITQNFDYDWKGYSFGIQPEVDHFAAAKALDIAGVDIYHPSQDALTGREISFGGDVARSMKAGKNYLLLETEAQGFPEWVPYPGQLRLQAFSHLACGANMVEYWHWHSIHNSAETYWKGLLSHDFEPNPTYDEAKTIGRDFQRLSTHLVNLKVQNKAAILFSNEALTAFNQFRPGGLGYNDVLRSMYDALYRMNVGVDFVDPTSTTIENYKLLIVPSLYAAPDSLLQRLNQYVKNGGHVVFTFKSGFSDQNVKVRSSRQPGIINESCGIYYNEFTVPENVSLKGDLFRTEKGNSVGKENNKVTTWMELITPVTARVIAYYDHPVWAKYAAVTENNYGKGRAVYIGCMVSDTLMERILADAVKKAGIWGAAQNLHFPIITKQGINGSGKTIHYIFNYSSRQGTIKYPFAGGHELLGGAAVNRGSSLDLEPWGVKIVEEGPSPLAGPNFLSPAWKISFSDSSYEQNYRPNIDSWYNVNFLLSWERQGYFAGSGNCCLARKFVVPAKYRDADLLLSLSLQCDVASIYINGKYVGGNLPNRFWSDSRGAQTVYQIPKGVLAAGENLIIIFASNLSYTGGKSFNMCSLTPVRGDSGSDIRIVVPAKDHLYTLGDKSSSIRLEYKTQRKATIDLLIVSDLHDTLVRKTLPANPGEGSISYNFTGQIKGPGFYECTAIMHDIGYAGAVKWFAVSPEKIKCSGRTVAGFSEYWEEALTELKAVAPAFKITKVAGLSTDRRDGYMAEMKSVNGITIRGYYFVPRAPGKYPAILHVPGYGYGFDEGKPFVNIRDNVIDFAICVRGHGISADVFHPGFGTPGIWGYKLCSEKDNAYRAIYMDCVRAVEFLLSRVEVDTNKIYVMGGSQGGGLALATAGLCHDNIKGCAYFDPFMTDTRDQLKIRTVCNSEIRSYLQYYNNECSFEDALKIQDLIDVKGFAERIECPVYFTTALFDDDCPSHMGFAAYNRIKTKKHFKIYPDDSHLAESGAYVELRNFLLGL
jgi:beta-galactosidase